MSKYFNMKLTTLDKETIKIGFPDQVKEKWLNNLKEKNISYVLFEKVKGELVENWLYKWKSYSNLYRIDLEDYKFTKERILWLKKFELKTKMKKFFY